jgi:hypothetical protein
MICADARTGLHDRVSRPGHFGRLTLFYWEFAASAIIRDQWTIALMRLWEVLVEAAGVELSRLSERTQVIDFNKRQNRQNRSFRRIEVHGGYTAPQPYAECAV